MKIGKTLFWMKLTKEINKLLPVFAWKQNNKFERKCEHGVVFYKKPERNLFDKERKKIQLQRFLCTAAYRR